MNVTDGRCYVESVESIEHDSNSAYIEVTEEEAVKQYKIKKTKDLLENSVDQYLVMKPEWDYVSPTEKY
jgi:chitinase